MLLESFLQGRSDRLIAAVRTALAAFALIAVWLDPSQPALSPPLSYALLGVYFAFAAATLFVSRSLVEISDRVAVAIHVVDLAVYSALMFLAEGATSPFFLLFTFSLVTATFRWQWRGALWTALSVLFLLVAIAIAHRAIAPDLPFETDRFVIRCAHVVVLGALLVYFGFHYQRLADEALRLAAWNPDPARDRTAVLEECLAHAANVFTAPRTVLLLQDQERWKTLAIRDDDGFRLERIPGRPNDLPPALLDARTKSFFPAPPDICAVDLFARAVTPYGPDQTLVAAIRAENFSGWMLVVGLNHFLHEDKTLAALVAAQIAVVLDRTHVVETMRQATAAEERLRLARDVHDGVLQSLAGVALQLENLKRDTGTDTQAGRARIDTMQAVLLREQRQLRAFLQRLQTVRDEHGNDGREDTLPAMIAGLEQQWTVTILHDLDGNLDLPAGLDFQMRQILREAVANAVRHGNASMIRLETAVAGGRLKLVVSDNGQGFPEDCDSDPPRSLRERVTSLKGQLVVNADPERGTMLEIELPVQPSGDRT